MTKKDPDIKEKVAQIKKLSKAGLSVTLIGRKMGITRGSVAGIAFRNGIKLERKISKKAPSSPKKKAKRKLKDRSTDNAIAINAACARLEGNEPKIPITEDLFCEKSKAPKKAERCAWPMGDPKTPEYHQCVKPVIERGEPYCEEHKDMSHIKTPPIKIGMESKPFKLPRYYK